VFKLKVLLDTNVIISALYVGGKPLKILELAESGDIAISLSPFILNEIQQVLTDKLGWERNKVRSVIAHLESLAEIVHPQIKLNVVKGYDADNRILEAALEAEVDFLITGDRRHLQPLKKLKQITILSPAEFLENLASFKKP